MLKKILASLLILTTISATTGTAFIAYAADNNTENVSSLSNIKEQIENLPEAVNYVKYQFDACTDSVINDGVYIIKSYGQSMILTNRVSDKAFYPVNVKYSSDSKTTIDNSIVDGTIEWKFTKLSNGNYYIQDTDGRYLSLNSYGNMSLSYTAVELSLEEPTNNSAKENACKLICNPDKSKNIALSMYLSDWFTVHNKNNSNSVQCMQLYKGKIIKSIQNNTVPLYNAIKNSQYYIQYNNSIESLINTAIQHYNAAYSGTISQYMLDNDTNDLNNIISKYNNQYETDKKTIIEDINSLYDSNDYKNLTLKAFATKEYIQNLRKRAQNFALADDLYYKIEYAYSIADGKIKYDSEREFKPERKGDRIKYATSELKMPWAGSNYQSTGIWANSDEKLRVYVTADDNDPLPSIVFVQHIGDCGRDQEIKLSKGENIIVVPNVYNEQWEFKTEPGGSIYIKNAYTPNQQSDNVKVYISNGDKFPIFKKGDNEKKFHSYLEEYYSHYKNGDKGYHNITEIVADHAIMTLTADECYKAYVQEYISPKKTVDEWDKFTSEMISVDGITEEQFKDQYINLKANQVGGNVGAYATLSLIALRCVNDRAQGLLMNGVYLWGLPHEFGHIMDFYYNDRTVQYQRKYAEITNNVWSMNSIRARDLQSYYILPKNINKISKEQSGYIYSGDDSKKDVYSLYMYWDLQCINHNYWATLDTYYRNASCGSPQIDSYLNSTADAITAKREKLAAYSSKIIGIDLTYYFQRWGYLSPTVSNNYKKAISLMNLSTTQPKIWYADYQTYDDSKSSYTGKNASVTIESVRSYGTNNYINFSVPTNCVNAHLGYEVKRNGSVIGFTYSNEFVDTEASSGTNYTYTVTAYDRAFNGYASVNFSMNDYINRASAKINGISYATLNDAVNAANNGDVIYILRSQDITSTISINNKNITIMPADNNKKYYLYNRSGANNMFLLYHSNVTIKTPDNSSDNMFVIDGQKIGFKSTAFNLNCDSNLTLCKGVEVTGFKGNGNGTVIQLNNSNAIINGAAVRLNYVINSMIQVNGDSTFKCTGGAIIEHNKSEARDGISGIICSIGKNAKIYIDNTTFYRNVCESEYNSSTIYMSKGNLYIGNGTYIYDNMSGNFNSASAAYINPDSNLQLSGKVNIPDNILITHNIKASSNLDGTVNVKIHYDYDKGGFVVVKPIDGTFTSTILNTFKYTNKEYNLNVFDGNVITEIPSVLKNISSISKTNATVGDSIKIKAMATGGIGKYNYAVFYKQASSKKWTVVQNYKPNTSVKITPQKATAYDVCVKVKDSNGTIAKKYFKFNVKNQLANSSSLGVSTITLGNSATVNCKATGGIGKYNYAVFYKRASSKKWTVVQNYKPNTSVKITPQKATAYDVCVKVKDSNGTIAKKYFKFNVKNQLANSSSLGVSTITLGNSATVNCKATGGIGKYNYAVFYKQASSKKWTVVQNYKPNTSVKITPQKATAYDVCVKVKDSNGTIAKKYFKLNVKNQLANSSSLGVSTITLGNSATVNCKATGGIGKYNYAVFYKQASSTKWTVVQNYKPNASVKITPQKATAYDVCVKVKDSNGTIAKKYFKLNVKNQLANNSSISTEKTTASSVTLSCSASNGTAPYSYKVEKIAVGVFDSWEIIQNYSANSTIKVSLSTVGTYQIRITAKDKNGLTAVKYFTVKRTY